MSKFLRVKCDQGHESIVFGDSKSSVKCKSCGQEIVRPSGGHALLACSIQEILS
ncbi:MAG TPA: hypothetical protein VGQ00_01185 [Candidatus Norongarragalinales archaeon]|nr:hypothetical protein [Candidatus Norongarragalinales archaeon]